MKTRFLVVAAIAVMFLYGTASAGTVEYTYRWTAADMLKNEFDFVDGGTTPASVGLFDGAGYFGVGSQYGGNTYVEDEHQNFNDEWNRLVNGGFYLDEISLQGRNYIEWGQNYKPYQGDGPIPYRGDELKNVWKDITVPDGWTTGFYNHGPWFYAGSPDHAVPLNAPDTWDSYKFSVTIVFDEKDHFWGENINGAPNQLDAYLTMWAKGWFTTFEKNANGRLILVEYQTNMVVNAIPQPEPTTLLLLGAGLLGVARLGRKKFFDK